MRSGRASLPDASRCADTLQGDACRRSRRRGGSRCGIEKQVVKALRKAKGRPLDAPSDRRPRRASGGLDARPRSTPTLHQLVRSGHGRSRSSPGASSRSASATCIVGRISVMTRAATASSQPPGGDVYVAARDMGGAMHGDLVAVRLQRRGERPRPRRARSSRIVERATDELVGRFEKQGRAGDRRRRATAASAATSSSTRAASARRSTGDIVVGAHHALPDADAAGPGRTSPRCSGPEGAPGVDIEIIIREHGLRTRVPGRGASTAAAGDPRGGAASRRPGRRGRARPLHGHDRPGGRARLRRRDLARAREGGLAAVGAHRRRQPLRAVGLRHRRRGAQARDLASTSSTACCRCCPSASRNGTCSLKPGVDRLTMTVDDGPGPHGPRRGATRLFPSVMRSRPPARLRRGRRVARGEARASRTRRPSACSRTSATSPTQHRQAPHRRAAGSTSRRSRRRSCSTTTATPRDVALRERTVATNMIEEAMIARQRGRGARTWRDAAVADGLPHPRGPRPRRARAGRGHPQGVRLPDQGRRAARARHVPEDHRASRTTGPRSCSSTRSCCARSSARATSTTSARTSAWRATRTRTSRAPSAATPTSSCTGCCARSSPATLDEPPTADMVPELALARRAQLAHGARGGVGRERHACSSSCASSWPTTSARCSTASSPNVDVVRHVRAARRTPPRASST